MTQKPAARMIDLTMIAAELRSALDSQTTDALSDVLDVQALCVAEEAGEVVGAYRRWAGKARRAG